MAGIRLLLVPALDARLLQQLAVLLLRHALAALLDDRAHETTLLGLADDGHANTLARSGRLDTHPTLEVTVPTDLAGHSPVQAAAPDGLGLPGFLPRSGKACRS